MTTPGIGPDENLWTAAVRRNPQHAAGYAARWKRLAAAGQDLDGEARLIDAMARRGSRILDAGCGTGRVGGRLARAGHEVVGVDLDADLIEVARAEQPRGRWEVGNLAELDLVDGEGEREQFDLEVCAGNVLTFLAGAERRAGRPPRAPPVAVPGRCR
ncbi:class I SAM-dependent methyltransferase [Brachybacterium paraconglomeratum]|uniref:class I SAM-dependent methyltransferase n=1 Tax=Brachybacterium paraconglomeratum TaxID=173362 RepID=UPI0028833DA0|nr:class I SAM-dependent methyltransferase [Brachybacterium paraconglomeratum]